MASTTSTLTFKPWPRQNEDEQSLKSILERIQLDRGHFRDITEQSLQEEVAAEGALQSSENTSSDDESSSDEEGGRGGDEDGEEHATTNKQQGDLGAKPKTFEEIVKAKFELLQHVRDAQNDIDYARDFMSLLISKDLPRQAASSIAPNLAAEIPMGTLGLDMWQRMPVDKAREAQDALLATRVRMDGLQKSADSLIAAASRLEGNMQEESEYWEQILSISEKGWNVSRLPGQHHRLGVRFGFSESSNEFSGRGLAALNLGKDGNVTLDSGLGTKLKNVQATIRRNGQIVAVSNVQSMPDEGDTPLETQIRYARDSLFDEELYREMLLESRSIAALGASMDDTSIVFPISTTGTSISFDLVPLSTEKKANTDNISNLAQMSVVAARILLARAHRDRLAQKSELPPPMSEDRKDERPTLPILRPILAFALHKVSIDQVNSHLALLEAVLRKAEIVTNTKNAQLQLQDDVHMKSAQDFTTSLMQAWKSDALLEVNIPEAEPLVIRIDLETTLARSFGTTFTMQIQAQPQRYRFDRLSALVEAIDEKMASLLAQTLAQSAGVGWEYVRREARLTRLDNRPGKIRDVTVEISSDKQKLALVSSQEEVKWTTDGDGSEKRFWDAWNELIQL